MNKIRLFQVLSLLMVVTLFSCSKEDAPYQEDDKFYTVSLNFIGDITTADSPLTRGTATSDLYGLLVWKDGDFLGGGLYDNIEDMKFRLQASKKYKFVVTAVKNGKYVLQSNFVYDRVSGFGYPFLCELNNLFSMRLELFGMDLEDRYSAFKSGDAHTLSGKLESYPETDRFYGEVIDYIPTENGVVNMDLKRTAFGLKYEVSGVSDGTVTVAVENSIRKFFNKSDITADYTSEEKIITFKDVYSAWKYADNYTENVKVSVSWKRGIGITQDLGSKEVVVKRNKMNIIHIKLATDESGKNLGIDVESDANMKVEEITVPME